MIFYGGLMKMQKKELLYEGKAKKVYTTEDPEVYIVAYKEDATAFNGLKKGTIVGKGVVNNEMSNFMFRKMCIRDSRRPGQSASRRHRWPRC